MGLMSILLTVSDLNYYIYILSFLASFHYEPLKVIQHTQNWNFVATFKNSLKIFNENEFYFGFIVL